MNFNFGGKKHDDFLQFEVHATSTMVVVWKIRRPRFFPKSMEYKLDSPSFVFRDSTWCLRLYPNAYCREDGKTYIGLTVVRVLSHVPRQRLSVVMKAEMIGENSLVADFDHDRGEVGDLKFLPPAWGVLKTLSSLTLMCQITPCGLPVGEGSSRTESNLRAVDGFSQTYTSQDAKAVEALCLDYKNLLLHGQDYDVVLKAGSTEFHAHRNILGARSPVFRSMMSHDMIEKRDGVINISDCNPNTLRQFLLYLYCGNMDALPTDYLLFKQLYYLADKYDVEPLKKECRQSIKKSLSPRHVVDVFQTAKKHSDTDLIQSSEDYFVKEVNQVLATAEWKTFTVQDPLRANELLMSSVKKLSEKTKPKYTYKPPNLDVARPYYK